MIRVFLVSATRLYRDGLADALRRQFELGGAEANVLDAVADNRLREADVVLIDGDTEDSVAAIRAVIAAAPNVKVVALAMPEFESNLIALAEAGISGYVSRDGSMDDLIAVVESVARDEMLCSPQMAASLLRRVKALAAERSARSGLLRLTARQLQIVGLLEEGLTNKEIALRLCIEPPTVKNHLHTIFERLEVRRRAEVVAQARSGRIAAPPAPRY